MWFLFFHFFFLVFVFGLEGFGGSSSFSWIWFDCFVIFSSSSLPFQSFSFSFFLSSYFIFLSYHLPLISFSWVIFFFIPLSLSFLFLFFSVLVHRMYFFLGPSYNQSGHDKRITTSLYSLIYNTNLAADISPFFVYFWATNVFSDFLSICSVHWWNCRGSESCSRYASKESRYG